MQTVTTVAPVLLGVELTTDGSDDGKWDEIGDEITLTFSENVKIDHVSGNLKNTGTTKVNLVAAIDIDPAGGTTAMAFTENPTFAVAIVSGNKLTMTIEANAVTTEVIEVGKATFNTKGTASQIMEASGTNDDAPRTTWLVLK